MESADSQTPADGFGTAGSSGMEKTVQGRPDFIPTVAPAGESSADFADFIRILRIFQAAAKKAVDLVVRFGKLPQRIVPELTRDPAAVQLRCDPFGAETLFGVMPRYGNRIARIVEVCMVTQPFDGSVCGSRGCSFPQELVPQFLFGMRPVREKTQRTFPRKGGGGLLL